MTHASRQVWSSIPLQLRFQPDKSMQYIDLVVYLCVPGNSSTSDL